MGNFDAFLSHFPGAKRQGNKAVCHCPAHDDKHASLSITFYERKNKILIHCFAGCLPEDILKAVNLKLADLLLDGSTTPAAIYQYRDKDGAFLYEKLKYRYANGSKKFVQRRDSGGKIVYDLREVPRVPFNYPG